MKRTKSKFVYVIGSAVIGIIATVCVVLGLFVSGAFDARSVKLVLETDSNEMVYDGTALEDDGWKLLGGELKDGHQLFVEVTGSRTEAGSSDNDATVLVKDRNGADVTGDYQLDLRLGTLTVHKRPISIYSGSDDKVYDGTPLTCDDPCTWGAGQLLSGHAVETEITGSQTNAGEGKNFFTTKIVVDDQDPALRKDVTHNYDIRMVEGALTVGKLPITISSVYAEKEYDGKPIDLDADTCIVTSVNKLVEGHYFKATLAEAPVAAGRYKNAIDSIVVYDGDDADKDVTDNYAITPFEAELVIMPRRITVRAASFSRIYDGTLQTDDTVTIEEGSVLDGHQLTAKAVGGIIYVGETTNEVVATITDAGNVDVTSNYAVTHLPGVLKITPRPIMIQTEGAEQSYTALELTRPTPRLLHGDGLFDLADGDRFGVFEATGSIINVGEKDNELRVEIVNGNNTPVTGNYAIEKVIGKLVVTPLPIYAAAGIETHVYDGQEFRGSQEKCTLLAGTTLVQGHTVESYSLAGAITNVGNKPNVIEAVKVVDAAGVDVSRNYVLHATEGELSVTPYKITIETDGFERRYDGTELTMPEARMSAIVGNELIVGHGFKTLQATGKITNAGKELNSAAVTIIDADGNEVTGNYEIERKEGMLVILPIDITIEAGDYNVVYDGEEHSGVATDCKLSSGSILFDGHVIRACTLSGKRTDVGTTGNVIETVEIVDGADNPMTQNYNITKKPGIIKITPRPIKIQTDGDTKVYDGTPLTVAGAYLVAEDGNELLDGHDFETLKAVGTITYAGHVKNEAEVVIIDENGVDVTANYNIIRQEGWLVVNKKVIYISTGDGEKTYDGTPLTNATIELMEGSELLDCDSFALFETIGKLTNVGEADNEAQIKIVGADGDPRANDSYDIVCVYGKLEVFPIALTIESGSLERMYNGQPLVGDKEKVVITSEDSLLDNHTLAFELTGSQLEVGSSVNRIVDVTVWAEDDEGNKTRVPKKNYDITVIDGTLTVLPIPISVVADTATKDYDGTPLTCDTYTLGYYDVLTDLGHKLAVTIVGERTTPGVSPNQVVDVRVIMEEDDGNGGTTETDVTSRFYTVSTYNGELVVKGDMNGDQNQPLANPSMGDPENDEELQSVVAEVYSDYGGNVYLRSQSFGDYTGKTFNQAVEYGGMLEDPYV